ncbi:hypothetical protein [Roseibium sp. Sym1]|uniref:hypothetical protein n=1 Tax=Roseibium sp. Sym1 TaxID=3016006 RepID=UPI0022B3819B|nr:hypothetical protein [Roseibium sp. Sym1]
MPIPPACRAERQDGIVKNSVCDNAAADRCRSAYAKQEVAAGSFLRDMGVVIAVRQGPGDRGRTRSQLETSWRALKVRNAGRDHRTAELSCWRPVVQNTANTHFMGQMISWNLSAVNAGSSLFSSKHQKIRDKF